MWNYFLPLFLERNLSLKQEAAFYSDIRDESIALNALLDVDPSKQTNTSDGKSCGRKIKHTKLDIVHRNQLLVSWPLEKWRGLQIKITAYAEIIDRGKKVTTMANGSVKLTTAAAWWQCC
jgi:hypothetical protein